MKTNAARYLDPMGVKYLVHEYDLNGQEFSGVVVAHKTGMPVEQVFKTLVAETDEREAVFAVIPVAEELDFKKLAAAAGTRRTHMVAVKDIEQLTGYVRGGVTVFAAKRPLRTFVNATAQSIENISVSAGTRGAQLVMKAEDFLRAAQHIAEITVADLTRNTAGSGARALGSASQSSHRGDMPPK